MKKLLNLQVNIPDPLGILSSTKEIVEEAQHVFINTNKIRETAEIIANYFSGGLDEEKLGFKATDNMERDLQLLFIEDAVNFCFWSKKDIPKWQVALPDGNSTEGGWYGLQACFNRALKNGVPILDPDYLASFSFKDAKKFFQSSSLTEIPLIEERASNLQEAGKILKEKFNGKFITLLEKANYDAIELSKLIIENFPSFRDSSIVNGKEVNFFKRAQICANDVKYILQQNGKEIKNINKLTAFADYKLPQLLRMFGVLEYTEWLASKIDNYEEIDHDSSEEIEIRASTVWAVELLRRELPKLTASDIDNTIWLMSQSTQKDSQPYHRTRTIFY